MEVKDVKNAADVITADTNIIEAVRRSCRYLPITVWAASAVWLHSSKPSVKAPVLTDWMYPP